jgi:hypothetical protein
MADEEDTAPEQSEAEVKAREQGWLPKEEFKGKAELWKPAEEWLERSGSRYVPALEKKIGQLERKLAEKEANTEAAIKRLEGTMKAHYQVQIDAMSRQVIPTLTTRPLRARRRRSRPSKRKSRLPRNARTIASRQRPTAICPPKLSSGLRRGLRITTGISRTVAWVANST